MSRFDAISAPGRLFRRREIQAYDAIVYIERLAIIHEPARSLKIYLIYQIPKS
jgi:hypothetical protein